MIRINLLPVRHSRRQEAVRNELIVAGIGVAAMFVAMAGAFVVLSTQVGSSRSENRSIQKDIDRTQQVVAEVDEQERMQKDLQVKLGVIKQLKANRVGPVHMLDELSQATPEKLQMTMLEEDEGQVKLSGVAVTNEIISQFLSNLEASEYFTDVYLNAIDQTEASGVKLKNFSITSRLVVPGMEAVERTPAAGKKKKRKKRKK